MADFLPKIFQSGESQSNSNWWTLNGHLGQPELTVGGEIEQAIRLGFNASNNESEYEAILAEIELATTVSADMLLIQSDSQLVVGQVNEDYESRDPRMAKYVSLVKQRLGSLETWKLEHIPRDYNEKADALAVVATSLLMTETVFLPIYYQLDLSIVTTRVS